MEVQGVYTINWEKNEEFQGRSWQRNKLEIFTISRGCIINVYQFSTYFYTIFLKYIFDQIQLLCVIFNNPLLLLRNKASSKVVKFVNVYE